MAKDIVAVVLALAASGCATDYSLRRDLHFPIETSTVAKEFTGPSDYTVAIIPDIHRSYGCHANIFLTLESMLDDIKFVARQERSGPTEHTNADFQHMRYFDHELETLYYRDFLAMSFEQRKSTAHQWITQQKFPSQYSHATGETAPLRDWRYVEPMMAPVLFEAVYQDRVATIGVEDPAFLKAAAETYVQDLKEKKLTDEQIQNRLLTDRNKAIVVNIGKLAGTIETGTLVPLEIGFKHVPGLSRLFEGENISYRVVVLPSCVPQGWSLDAK